MKAEKTRKLIVLSAVAVVGLSATQIVVKGEDPTIPAPDGVTAGKAPEGVRVANTARRDRN